MRTLAIAIAGTITLAALVALPSGGKMYPYDNHDVGDSNDCRASASCDNHEDWKCFASGREVWKVFCARYWNELWPTEIEDESEKPDPHTWGYYDCDGVADSKDCVWVEK
jgi:hypothetical protein